MKEVDYDTQEAAQKKKSNHWSEIISRTRSSDFTMLGVE